MPSKKHICGKRYTQVRKMGDFIGLVCSKCGVVGNNTWDIREQLRYRDLVKGIVKV